MRIVIVFLGFEGYPGCAEYRALSGPFFFCKKSARSGEDRAEQGYETGGQSSTIGDFFLRIHESDAPMTAASRSDPPPFMANQNGDSSMPRQIVTAQMRPAMINQE